MRVLEERCCGNEFSDLLELFEFVSQAAQRMKGWFQAALNEKGWDGEYEMTWVVEVDEYYNLVLAIDIKEKG